MVVSNVRRNAEFLKSAQRPFVLGSVFNMLVSSVTCLKHTGFEEEKEWRAVYAPKRLPSMLMEHSTEVVGGVPQQVYKLPLDIRAFPLLADLDFARVFDRLIIGPSQYSWAMYEAFVDALKGAGVTDAHQRVCASGIPIRT